MEPVLRLLELPFVQEFMERIAGDRAVEVMRLMVDLGNAVTDEQVAEKMGVKVTVVRAVLNRLHFWGVADYTKTRDEETGWYTYTWSINKEKMKEAIMHELEGQEEELRTKLNELDQFMFFVCPNGHVREPFETAAEYTFKCPVCGADLEPLDVESEKNRINAQLDDIWKAKQILSEI